VSNELCTAYAYVSLSLADKEDIDDAFYCNQFQHVLNLSHLEAKGVLFLWSNNSTNSETTYSQKGLHWVETTQQHCIHKDTFLIANSVIDLDLGQDFHSCDTLNVMLDGGPDGVMYNWNTGEATRAISVSSPGVYIVEVEDSSNCFKADTIDLTLSLAPKYELGSDTTICVNSPLWLTGPSDYGYLWSTGEIEQQIVTSKSGLYILTITDSLGCTGADSLSVNVDPGALPSDLYVPNSFTPNEDGLNEYFPYKIPVKQLEYHLEIYSRWGEKIFDSNKSESGNWNGYYKGRRVPQETFMYQMQYRGCDGNVRNKSGTVHVLYN
jgi:gliding motility-associated-like protein